MKFDAVSTDTKRTLTICYIQLNRKDTASTWGIAQEKAFEKLKKALTTNPIMGYFDGKRNTYLYLCARPVSV